jgi:hypothetical protein
LGNVIGPVTATNNAIARFNTGIGNEIKNSTTILSDTGIMQLPGRLSLPDTFNSDIGVISMGNVSTFHNYGINNMFVGKGSGNFITSGSGQNVGIGPNALSSNTTGSSCTALGYNALLSSTGINNIGIGSGAGSSLTGGGFNICIGNAGVVGESSTIRVGDTQNRSYFAGIHGITPGGSGILPVVIDSNGQLGSTGGIDFVSSPGVSTDNAIPRYDGFTGKIIQNSGVTLSDTSIMTFPGSGQINVTSVRPITDLSGTIGSGTFRYDAMYATTFISNTSGGFLMPNTGAPILNFYKTETAPVLLTGTGWSVPVIFTIVRLGIMAMLTMDVNAYATMLGPSTTITSPVMFSSGSYQIDPANIRVTKLIVGSNSGITTNIAVSLRNSGTGIIVTFGIPSASVGPSAFSTGSCGINRFCMNYIIGA